MADLLTELTAYLATAAGLAVGTTLYRGTLPLDETKAANATTVSAITNTGGVTRGELPLKQATFQIITRGRDLDACNLQANALYAATLDSHKQPKIQVALATLKLARIEPIQPPTDIGVDNQGRRRTTFNILVLATE